MDVVTIYVLQLEQDKYYVGKTKNYQARLLSHFTNNGSAWTREYKPIDIIEIVPDCDDYDEDKYTRMYMDMYGVNNVRGGSFVAMKLPSAIIQHLIMSKLNVQNRCFLCGESGHFATTCHLREITCMLCNNTGHYANKCPILEEIGVTDDKKQDW